jgi:hypothetical protein
MGVKRDGDFKKRPPKRQAWKKVDNVKVGLR